MSQILILPIAAVVLWLVHVGLGAAGHPAYRYSRWILFGGLAASAVAFFLLGIQASNNVPTEWKDDSLGGVFQGVLAVETLLVMLALALLEVIRMAVAQTIQDARTRADSRHSDPSRPL